MIINSSKSVGFTLDSITTRKKTLALVISAVLGSTQTAYAQDAVLEEVIVTASKRKSNLQDLPQAITAFTTEDIARQGFTDMDSYVGKIPSLGRRIQHEHPDRFVGNQLPAIDKD